MSDILALSILETFEIAVLRRVGPLTYTFYGTPPLFYTTLFPGAAGEPCVRPWEYSPVLELFIHDAESYFTNPDGPGISSGIWQEDGKIEGGVALVAMAVVIAGEELLIIRLLQEEFTQRTGILRKAREELLHKDELTRNLALFKEKSRVDGLTKIFNRSAFMELLQEEMVRSEGTGAPLSLVMVDIDDFKLINDTNGHVAGDYVLEGLGNLLLEHVRREDIVARYGGEEFVLLIPRGGTGNAAQVAEKLRKSIEEYDFTPLPGITASMGCTSYKAGESAEAFINRADTALYAAKRGGKNKVCTA